MNIENIKQYISEIKDNADYIYQNSEVDSVIEEESEQILQAIEGLILELGL